MLQSKSFGQVLISENLQIEHNSKIVNSEEAFDMKGPKAVVPYPEYLPVKYLVLSLGGVNGWATQVKKEMIQKLPADVKVVVYWASKDLTDIQKIQDWLGTVLLPERFFTIHFPTAVVDPIWARDSWPLAVYSKDHGKMRLSLVGAKYFQLFEPEVELSKLFRTPIYEHEYYFEGGNFLSNAQADCFVTDNNVSSQIPDQLFHSFYGCLRVFRLPHLRGIGHVDEVLKFVNDKTALTDEIVIFELLKKWGFKAVLLPRPLKDSQNYLNSVLLNKTVLMPVFEQSTDETAKNVYQKLGWNVQTINMKYADSAGLLHCLTMTYPKGIFDLKTN